MSRSNFTFLLIGLLTATACSTGNCRLNEEAEKRKKADEASAVVPAAGASAAGQTSIPARVTEKVRVFKYDGSRQCGQGKPISVDEMKKELKNIKVYSAENKPDNLIHASACGLPTGKANVFEIDRKDLEAAKKLGFKNWTFD